MECKNLQSEPLSLEVSRWRVRAVGGKADHLSELDGEEGKSKMLPGGSWWRAAKVSLGDREPDYVESRRERATREGNASTR